jgi:hypothetical protein
MKIDPEKNKKFHMEFLEFLYKSYPNWVTGSEIDSFISNCSIFKGDKDKEREAERNIYYLIEKGYVEIHPLRSLKYLKTTPEGADFLVNEKDLSMKEKEKKGDKNGKVKKI